MPRNWRLARDNRLRDAAIARISLGEESAALEMVSDEPPRVKEYVAGYIARVREESKS